MHLTGSLGSAFFAMLAFVGGHLLLSWPPVRGRIVATIGEALFSLVYSLLMAAFLVWLIAAYRVAPPLVIYDLGRWVNMVPIVTMPFALVLIVLGLTARSPTAMGGTAMLGKDLHPRGIHTVTRHPLLCATTLWAAGHLIANGDAASIMLFGGMAVLSVVGMMGIDHKRALRLGDAWLAFAARTSRFPLAAAWTGRVTVDWAGIGWLRPLIGLALYGVLYVLHDRLFGVPVVIV